MTNHRANLIGIGLVVIAAVQFASGQGARETALIALICLAIGGGREK